MIRMCLGIRNPFTSGLSLDRGAGERLPMCEPLSSNSPRERIGLVEKERSFSRHECAACNRRNDLLALAAIAASERAANDAFLDPCFIRREHSVRGQTG